MFLYSRLPQECSGKIRPLTTLACLVIFIALRGAAFLCNNSEFNIEGETK